MSVRITTNNVPRDVLQAWDLTPAERAQFDYVDWTAIETGEDSREFARYRGQLYDLQDTDGLASTVGINGWDLYVSDSFFSGIVIRWARTDAGELDTERVILGTYYVTG